MYLLMEAITKKLLIGFVYTCKILFLHHSRRIVVNTSIYDYDGKKAFLKCMETPDTFQLALLSKKLVFDWNMYGIVGVNFFFNKSVHLINYGQCLLLQNVNSLLLYTG